MLNICVFLCVVVVGVVGGGGVGLGAVHLVELCKNIGQQAACK